MVDCVSFMLMFNAVSISTELVTIWSLKKTLQYNSKCEVEQVFCVHEGTIAFFITNQ